MNNNNISKTYNYVSENNNSELIAIDYYGNRNLIGYSKSYVEELQAICLEHKSKKEEYYNLLIEHKIIEKELTIEEKFKILLEKTEKQENEIRRLSNLLEEKKGKKNTEIKDE